jgi:hypothetical protein
VKGAGSGMAAHKSVRSAGKEPQQQRAKRVGYDEALRNASRVGEGVPEKKQ